MSMPAVGVGALVGWLDSRFDRPFPAQDARIGCWSDRISGGRGLFRRGARAVLASAWLLLVGLAIVAQNAMANTAIQTLVPDDLRGRVMAVYMLTFFGTTPFGALQAGVLAQAFGTRIAIAIDGGITVAVAAAVLLTTPRVAKTRIPIL